MHLKTAVKCQTVKALMRLLLWEQSDLGLHCLRRLICSSTGRFQRTNCAYLGQTGQFQASLGRAGFLMMGFKSSQACVSNFQSGMLYLP